MLESRSLTTCRTAGCRQLWVPWLLWLLSLPVTSLAHEIPEDVRLQLYVQPAGERLVVLIRTPLVAMRDMDFPLRGPGYLVLDGIEDRLRQAVALWLLPDLSLYADGEVLTDPRIEAVRVALPSDRSFDDFRTARSAVYNAQLEPGTNLYWEQALLDVAIVYPLDPAAEAFEVAPGFARLGLRTVTRVTFLPEAGEPRTLVLPGDPGRIDLDPGPLSVLGRFLGDGFAHVLDGLDHLLFVAMLVLPMLMIRPLVVVVTAFTLAHSLTLVASALQLVPTGLWFGPLVELLIAASIFFMALENLLRGIGQATLDARQSLAPERLLVVLNQRWLVAFGFGLIHGFGFSFALQATLPLAGDHLLTSLIGFNLGIELGQILVVVVLACALRWLARRVSYRAIVLIGSALAAHTAWHWLLERWVVLDAFNLTVPTLDVSFLAGAARWLMLLLSAVFVVWLLRRPFQRWALEAARRDFRGRPR